MPVRKVTVPSDASPKIDRFLANELPNLTIERARAMLSQGRVKVNGKVAKPHRKLSGGEKVEVDFPDARVNFSKVEGPAIEVLRDTPHYMVVNKPSGFVVEPEPNQVSVVELVASQRGPFDVGGAAMPGIVHRLDKPTSGCLLFAKTDDGQRELEQGFEEKRIAKTYFALVLGTPPAEGRCDTPYARDPTNPRKYTSLVESPRRARLSFKRLEQFADGLALIEVALDTGRTHQIRVQLCDIGYPVLADPIYGPREVRLHASAIALGRLALHAARLHFNGEPEPVEAPLPADFSQVLSALRNDDRPSGS